MSDDSRTASEVGATPDEWQVLDGNVYRSDSVIAPFTGLDGVHHPDFRTGLIALVYGKEYAHQIAAVPDLLAALKALAEAGEEAWRRDRPCLQQARAAIAKAEGSHVS